MMNYTTYPPAIDLDSLLGYYAQTPLCKNKATDRALPVLDGYLSAMVIWQNGTKSTLMAFVLKPSFTLMPARKEAQAQD